MSRLWRLWLCLVCFGAIVGVIKAGSRKKFKIIINGYTLQMLTMRIITSHKESN